VLPTSLLNHIRIGVGALFVGVCAGAWAEESAYKAAYIGLEPWLEDIPEAPRFDGISGRVLCGYQGWFRCQGDGSGLGWRHYGTSIKGQGKQFRPGACSVDLWPDMSEYTEEERFDTPFRHADGGVAQVFSSQHPKSVQRHFRWMADYGIDGALVQRFASIARGGRDDYDDLAADNRKLTMCRQAANDAGVCWALMYDLSGVTPENMHRVVRDWKMLRQKMDLGNDPSYLHFNGRPLVAIWGGGFAGERRPRAKQVADLARLIKHNPDWGGCSVMLGVPTGWRERERDCIDDPDLEELFGLADILSPWSVGRYHRPDQVRKHAMSYWRPDIVHAETSGAEYLPVVFPGFSWHNHMHGEAELDLIPRLGGKFLWKQFLEAKIAGADAVYVAMFDEMDEGTAIFKCSSDPPVGDSPFVSFGELPSDHYLWLCGEAGKLLREELPVRSTVK